MVIMMNYEFKIKSWMKFAWVVFGIVLVPFISHNSTMLFAQQPQAPAGTPLYSVNAKYVNGVAPGYWATAGSGLTLNLSAGTAYCGNPPAPLSYPGGTLTMTANATNYVYLDPANSCAPAASTSAFTAGEIPIAKVVAGSSSIASVTDARTWFTPQPCATSAEGALDCSSLGTNQNIALTPSGTGASVITNFQDKGGQVFNIRAYGAKGDGATNDSPAFQAAYNAAAAAGGGTVLIPPTSACYLFNTPINMTGTNTTQNIFIVGTADGPWGGSSPTGQICGNTGGIVFDVSGSREITFKNLDVSAEKSGLSNPSLVGIYAARNSAGAGAQAINVIHCNFKMPLHTSGTTYSSGAYLYGSEEDYFADDVLVADYPLVVSESNFLSIHSAFITEYTSTSASNCGDTFIAMELESDGLGPALYISATHDLFFTGHAWNFSQSSSYSSSLYQYAIEENGTIWNNYIKLRNEGYPGWMHSVLSIKNSTFTGSDAPGPSPILHGVEFADAGAQILNNNFSITDEYTSSTTNYFYDATEGNPTGVLVLDNVNFACGAQANCIDIPVGNYNPGGVTPYSANIKYSSSTLNPNPSVIITGKTMVHTFSNPFTTTLPTATIAANSCNNGTSISNSQVNSNSTVLLNSTYWYGLTALVSNYSSGLFSIFLCNPTTSPITPGSGTMKYRVIN